MKRLFKLNKTYVCLSLIFSTFSTFAVENKDKQENIERIEVSGKRLIGVNMVDLSDIRKKQANDLADIFSGEPSITVGGSFGFAQKVYVRGIEDTNLNVSVDGATQAGHLFHHQGRLAIEPELIKYVDVKAGTGTALDGPGAIGGAIRFETKDVDDLLDTGERFGSLLKVGYFTNTEGHKLSGSFYGRFNDNWSGLAILGKNDSDNITDGQGNELQNTKTDQELGLFKINGQLSENQQIKLSHEVRNDDGVRNVRPEFYEAGWNAANEQKSRRETSTVKYLFTPLSDLIELDITAYKTDNYLTQNEGNDKRDGAGVKSTGFDVRNTSFIADHTLVYGVDHRSDTGYYINGKGVDEKGKVTGIYLQDTFLLSDQISFSAGVRYDKYKLDDADGQHFSSSGLSPNISTIVELSDNWSVRGSYSQAIRGQKVKEAYLIGYRKNASDLDKEKASNVDFTLSYRNTAGLMIDTQFFETRVKDVVGTIKQGDERVLGNAGELKTRGYSINASQRWENARLGINYAHTLPKLDGKPLDDSTPGLGTAFGDTLTVNANYQFEELDLELGWNARFVQSFKDVAEGHPDKPGYGVHDIYVEWFPLQREDLILNLSVNNLFDKYYFDHGTYGYDTDEKENIGLPEPGRDFRLTLSYKF